MQVYVDDVLSDVGWETRFNSECVHNACGYQSVGERETRQIQQASCNYYW